MELAGRGPRARLAHPAIAHAEVLTLHDHRDEARVGAIVERVHEGPVNLEPIHLVPIQVRQRRVPGPAVYLFVRSGPILPLKANPGRRRAHGLKSQRLTEQARGADLRVVQDCDIKNSGSSVPDLCCNQGSRTTEFGITCPGTHFREMRVSRQLDRCLSTSEWPLIQDQSGLSRCTTYRLAPLASPRISEWTAVSGPSK